MSSAGSAVPATPPAPARPPTPALRPLDRMEAELEAAWARLRERGHGYTAVRELLAAAPADGEDHGEDRQVAARREAALRRAHEAQQDFLARLDAFQRQIHGHFLGQVVRELDRAMETMREFYGPRSLTLWRLGRRHRRLARLALRYRELEDLYGTPRDHRRIEVYQRFYAGVVEFSRRIRALDPTAPRPAPPTLVDRLYTARRGLTWAARRSGAALRLVAAALGILGAVLSRRPPARGTPLTRRVDALFRAWGELRGDAVEVTGREHLEPLDPATVGLYAPAHRHGVTDNVTAAHLRLPDYLVFNAVDQLPGVPRFLKERAARTPGLIAVGGGRGSSVERALDALASGASRNLLIYPEGSVSEGFRGTRPPRPGFGGALVRRLREAGYPLRIVPIVYPDNARFLGLPPRSRTAADRRLRVDVAPALEAPMIDALLRVGGGEMVNAMVRLAWLERLPTDAERLLGHDRVSAIERRLDDELDGIRYWGSLEPAPVRDRLGIAGSESLRVYDEPFRGKRVRVLEIPESARDASGQIPLPDLQPPDSAELLIGMRDPAHIYLAAGRRRFDGDIFRRLKVKERDAIPQGIVVRFLGIPVKSLNAIRRRLEEYAGREQRTLTCANSACKLIARAANLEIDDHADLRPFLPSHVLPTRTMRKLIERGVRNHAGEPVEVQIYKTDPRPLESILAEARRAEIRIAADHLRMLSVGALRRLGRAARRLASRAISRLRSGR